jgi:hypothetical protein
MRAFLQYSVTEWTIIEQHAKSEGFSNLHNFIHSRLRSQLPKLPDAPLLLPEAVTTKTFKISDTAVEERLKKYCIRHRISKIDLLRRLITEPILAEHLLAVD